MLKKMKSKVVVLHKEVKEKRVMVEVSSGK